MPPVGQRVEINVQGLQTPGVSIRDGVAVTGVIVGISGTGNLLVKLDAAFGKDDPMVVSPDRVKPLS